MTDHGPRPPFTGAQYRHGPPYHAPSAGCPAGPSYSGYPPGPGYYYPAGAYPPYRPPGTNGKAVAGLVVALAGLLLCGLPSIVGLILGVVAMRETRRTGQAGWGIALAAIIVGGFVVAGWLLYVLLFIGVYASGASWAP